MLLEKVRGIIDAIAAKVDTLEGYEYIVSPAGRIDIQVSNENGQTVYNGYELALYEEAAQKIDPNATLQFTADEDGFHISTRTGFDLTSFIQSVNDDRSNLPEGVAAVLITDRVDPNADFDYCILTVASNGSWSRYDFSHAELVFVAVHGIVPTANENGVFVFAEMIERSRAFFDTLEAEKA